MACYRANFTFTFSVRGSVAALRAYGGMGVEIHLFCLSEVSSPGFSHFTLKVSEVMGSVGRGRSPDLETGRIPALVQALEAGSLSERSYSKVLGDRSKGIMGSVEQSGYLSSSTVRLSAPLCRREGGWGRGGDQKYVL